MDAFEMTSRLERANFKLKKGGAGVIFGLLSKLESKHLVRREEKPGKDRMLVTYHLTDEGTESLHHAKAPSAQLKAWSELVFSVG